VFDNALQVPREPRSRVSQRQHAVAPLCAAAKRRATSRYARVDDARVDDAQVDASQALLAAHLAELTTSRAKWRELAAASPGPYWYKEENCVFHAGGGDVNTIQVEQNISRKYEGYAIALSDCEATVNRYGGLFAPSGELVTMEQLYERCETQLRSRPESNFVLDARGVIKACWIGTAENPPCNDACGSGFYLRDWQFGKAQPTPDGGVRKDAGVTVDAGPRKDAGS